MSKTGKIKIIVLALAFIVNIINPVKVPVRQNFIFPAIILIFGSFALPFIIGLSGNLFQFDLIKPKFSDNPLTFKRILFPTSFFAQLFLVTGTGSCIGALIKYKLLSSFGISGIAYGMGLLIGIKLTLVWIKPRLAQPGNRR